MVTRARITAVVLACAALGACASKPAAVAETWSGGDPTHLAADEAYCRRDSDAVDVHEAAGYSDPRYGVTSAMAAAVSDYNPLVNQGAAIRIAAFDACMNDKGWKPQ